MKSLELIHYDINRAYFQENGETRLHLTRACVEHNAELRKTNAALCRGKHNAALFFNPDKGVRMTMQEDLENLLEDGGLKRNNIQIHRRIQRLKLAS